MGHMSVEQASLRLEEAGGIQLLADMYRQAIMQYREAISVQPTIALFLKRALNECPTCEFRCPGLPECERTRPA
jgi:hypothetical protein